MGAAGAHAATEKLDSQLAASNKWLRASGDSERGRVEGWGDGGLVAFKPVRCICKASSCETAHTHTHTHKHTHSLSLTHSHTLSLSLSLSLSFSLSLSLSHSLSLSVCPMAFDQNLALKPPLSSLFLPSYPHPASFLPAPCSLSGTQNPSTHISHTSP
jgi:hypothetical protein